jgi:protein O-GlcNAc transferase
MSASVFERSGGPVSQDAITYNDFANQLHQSGRSREAIAWYQKAIEQAPQQAELHSNLAAAWMSLGRFEDARPALEKALALDPSLGIAHCNLGTTLHALGRLPDALQAFRRAAHLTPDFIYPHVHALALARELASWTDWSALIETFSQVTPQPGNTAPPVDLLYIPISADQFKRYAECHAAELNALARTRSVVRPRNRSQGDRIRVGYVSDELRRHATGELLVEALELHDKRRFDVHVYSWGRDDASVVERRVRAAATVHDITSLTHQQTAARIMADGIDILIDLKGHTSAARTEVFALRPAPVQVSWLGFPGTLGTSFFDYLIADDFIVPAGEERHYTEAIVRLPGVYQPNDRRRPIAEPKARSAYGLPEDCTVFGYLGRVDKISPVVFGDWMEILSRTPRSILWLLAERPEVKAALASEASARGVDAGRLRFAGRLPLAEHIARFRVVDLALDTFPCGSHTTGSEALWASCPLITRAGETFASRVAGSLVRAAGLPQLVTNSAASFTELAVELGNDRARTAALRAQLEATRDSCALFDTPRFVRNVEAAFEQMHARAVERVL